MKGIILYGPPASGKDTISEVLAEIDPRCSIFQRLKVGSGKVTTYRIVTEDHIRELGERGDIAWVNSQYGATYAIDTPELRKELSVGIPIVHLGQIEAVSAVKSATPEVAWTVIALWCARQIAYARLQARNSSDALARLQVWDDTPRLNVADLAIDTGVTEPFAAARSILGITVHGAFPG